MSYQPTKDRESIRRSIEKALWQLVASAQQGSMANPPTRPKPSSTNLIDAARLAVAVGKQARRAFGPNADLLSSPVWDLMLDLYIADHDRAVVSVSSACIAANVPATTALRWMAALQTRGLIARSADPFDARRVFVRLTDAGREVIEASLKVAVRT